MQTENIKKEISQGQTILGIEFGSTRIKAVLIDSENEPVAQGAFDWENSLTDGIWTYPLNKIAEGLRASYADLKKDVAKKYGLKLTRLRALGISAMMHGYLAFDKEGNLLVPFRTWRNTMTGTAAKKLSALFDYPVPERWSIAHLYQAILNNEPHVGKVTYLTTLAGYVHWKLTGRKVIGIGDASGMFPIDTESKQFDKKMIAQFDALIADKNYGWKLESLLPEVLTAGTPAGTLSKEGAALIDADKELQSGVPLCPPEGDAGTGMAATNSVAPRTGNVSAGTSVFAMIVLEKKLSKSYSGLIDLVTTPDGSLAAMAHANNCTGEYDNWIRLFGEAAAAAGCRIPKPDLYDALLFEALKGEKNCGGLIPYNYISGESMTGLTEGRPLFVRTSTSHFTLANFMRAQLFTALGALRTGMDILFDEEQVKLDRLTGHGGFFKTAEVGLKIMAAAMHTSVSALETAGEGGPWGMALLASYLINGKGQMLSEYLEKEVFAGTKATTVTPDASDIKGFNEFFTNYKKGLTVERAAVENID
jgi:sugar (pentulose or hexulose) kinase